MKAEQYFKNLDTESRKSLAAVLGVNVEYLRQVMLEYSGRQAGPKLALKIESETKGVVSRVDLRPDLYGDVVSKAG